MIKDIRELNFPSYATLSNATVNEADMGEKTITATIKIDGKVVPDFSYDWEIEFNGEKYIHHLRKPQATKENTDIRSSIDLTFRHWAIHELQRYFFVEMSSVVAGTAIPDKYEASLSLNLEDFIDAFNRVLDYYFNGRIRCDLNPDWQYAIEPTTITISYSYIWDVLAQMYDLYGIRWSIATDPIDTGKAIIKFGYPTQEIDHIFEYGYKGGLLKVERQVQSNDIRNILLGRGGEKNLPYRYFKNIDPDNPSFPADPDWVYELKDIYFDRIRDAAFRSYVQGWKYKHRADYENEEYQGQFVGRNDAAVAWAWDKGYNDTKFDPVEFVADEITASPTAQDKKVEIYPSYTANVKAQSSIDKYGVLFGSLQNNDDIYPTIQGVSIAPYGRIDQAVAVSEIVNDDVVEGVEGIANLSDLPSCKGSVSIANGETKEMRIPVVFYGYDVVNGKWTQSQSPTVTIPSGEVGNFREGASVVKGIMRQLYTSTYKGDYRTLDVGNQIEVRDTTIEFIEEGTARKVPASGVPSGTWRAEIVLSLHNNFPQGEHNYQGVKFKYVDVTVSFASPSMTIGHGSKDAKWKETFEVWVKNIWQTSKLSTESAEQYAERVWKPILGDRTGDEAKLVFASGLLSISEDYEFIITKTPEYDTSKTLQDGMETVPSEWKITLGKSDAELDTTGKYIPNSQINAAAGDYFFLIGIDMPYLYYTEAEKRLTNYKRDGLKDVSDIKPTWVLTLDKVRLGRAHGDELEPLFNILKVGNTLRLADERFIREVGKEYETLYIQSITRNYKEPVNGDPMIVPDIEIVLSDSYSTSASPVATMQGEISELQKQVGSISNIEQLVRAIGDKLYLRKDGISDLSYSPTKFTSLVTSSDFRQGQLGGQGWGVYRDPNGNAVIEVDRAVFRQSLSVTELIINQVSARGGMIVESAAAIECNLVVDTPEGYYCYFDQKQGTVYNWFKENDIAFNEQWDEEKQQTKFYKREITAVGDGYILLSKTNVNGDGIPQVGDTIIHYGNTKDANRQFVIIRDTVNGAYERFLDGLDSVYALGTEYWFVGRQGQENPRLFIGARKDNQYIEFKDGKLIIPATLITQSTFNDGSTLEQYINNAGVSEEEARNIAQQAAHSAQEAANAYADTIVNGLQEQIDGKVETWFYEGIPTLQNEPAINWVRADQSSGTNNEKDNHLGDLYYDQNSGRAYRFMKNAQGQYLWQEIADTAISEALAAAQAAQSTANNKRRIFVRQPTNADAYDVGDLWVNAYYSGSGYSFSNDVLVCNTAKTANQAFSIAHWGKASKYTDDTVANEAKREIEGYSYLKKALEQGSTAIQGGLVLTSLIQLGMTTTDGYTVYSGINGIVDSNKYGYGIAAWYGGAMADGEANKWAVTNPAARYAKSLFRFDGSGYLSNGAITWNADGSGSVGNGVLSWTRDGDVTLGAGVKLGASNETLATIANFMTKFNNMFELVVWQNKTLIHAKYDGFYSDGEITALGRGTMTAGGQSGVSNLGDLSNVADAANNQNVGTVNRILVQAPGTSMWTTLNITDIVPPVSKIVDLSDVYINNVQNGQSLVYNGGVWQNAFIQGGGSNNISGLRDVELDGLMDYDLLSWDSFKEKWVNISCEKFVLTSGSSQKITGGVKTFVMPNPMYAYDENWGDGGGYSALVIQGIRDSDKFYPYSSDPYITFRSANGTFIGNLGINNVGAFVNFIDTNGLVQDTWLATVDQLPDLSNYVTLDTEQTITSKKTFKNIIVTPQNDNYNPSIRFSPIGDESFIRDIILINGRFGSLFPKNGTREPFAYLSEIEGMVRTTGDQTISGKKTFSSLVGYDITLTTSIPFAAGYVDGRISFRDTDGTIVGKLGVGKDLTLGWYDASNEYHPFGADGGATTLASLTDVTLTNAKQGDLLSYDGNKWVNGNPLSEYLTEKRIDAKTNIDTLKNKSPFIVEINTPTGTLPDSSMSSAWIQLFNWGNTDSSSKQPSYGTQMAAHYTSNGNLYFRNITNAGIINPWKTLLDSTNYKNYALSLSGGTMTNTNVVQNLNADLLDGKHATDFVYDAGSKIPGKIMDVPLKTVFSAECPSTADAPVNYGWFSGLTLSANWNTAPQYRSIIGTSTANNGEVYVGFGSTNGTIGWRKIATTNDLASYATIAMAKSIAEATRDGIGIYPFDGIVYNTQGINYATSKPGQIFFVAKEGRFVETVGDENNGVTGVRQYTQWPYFYTDSDGFQHPANDVVFRCGARLYIPIGNNSSPGTCGLISYINQEELEGSFTGYLANYLSLNGGSMRTSAVVTNLNADLWDGEHLSSFSLLKDYIIDLRSLSSSNFYPVTVNRNFYSWDCEIHSPSFGGAEPYNQNTLRFLLQAEGWSDTPKRFVILYQAAYQYNEITIGAVGYGAKANAKRCVWLRGGLQYKLRSNMVPTLRTSTFTEEDSTYSVGPNLDGGTNVDVTILWKNNGSTKSDYTVVLQSDLTSTLGGYLPLTGGSLSGALTVNGAMKIKAVGDNYGGDALTITPAGPYSYVSGKISLSQWRLNFYVGNDGEGTSWEEFMSVGGQADGGVLELGIVNYEMSVRSYTYFQQGVWLNKDAHIEGNLSAKKITETSDERLKGNIRPLTDLTLKTIAAAPLVRFNWLDNGEEGLGTIAQYWQKVFPDVVSTTNKGTLGINKTDLCLASSILLARDNIALRYDLTSFKEWVQDETFRLKQRVKDLEREVAILKGEPTIDD